MTILIIEDDVGHYELIERCFNQQSTAKSIRHIADGESALDYLFQRGKFTDPVQNPRPNLILLDIRIPKIDGLNVLKQIKESPDLRYIPVIILTTSKSMKDLKTAYDNYVNSYLVKPTEFKQLKEMIRDLENYWLSYNQQPIV